MSIKGMFRVGNVALMVENKEQYDRLISTYGHLPIKEALQAIVVDHCQKKDVA